MWVIGPPGAPPLVPWLGRTTQAKNLSPEWYRPCASFSNKFSREQEASVFRSTFFVAILLSYAFAETPPRFVCLCGLDDGRQVRFCSTPTKVFAWHARCPWSGLHCRICFRPC